MKNLIKVISLPIIITLCVFKFANAETKQEIPIQQPIQNNYEGVIKSANNEPNGQYLEVLITTGEKKGQRVFINTGLTITETHANYKVSDKVLLLSIVDQNTNKEEFYITDYKRTNALFWLFVLFCIVVIGISSKWGITSILGMFYSFFIIFKFLLPQLLQGHNPLFITIIASFFIAPVTFYLSHGFNKKTSVALLSTLISLFITGLLAALFIELAKITGFSSDEAFFLQIAKENVVNIKGIFLAGIVIGALGILDDITISQAAIVSQLRNSVRGIDDFELYKKAMEIGHDHIASAVNTLVLVYTGAALPLLLLFINSSKSFGDAVNSEIIADEIVRTLVGSIGLVLAVPISTMLAVFFVKANRNGA